MDAVRDTHTHTHVTRIRTHTHDTHPYTHPAPYPAGQRCVCRQGGTCSGWVLIRDHRFSSAVGLLKTVLPSPSPTSLPAPLPAPSPPTSHPPPPLLLLVLRGCLVCFTVKPTLRTHTLSSQSFTFSHCVVCFRMGDFFKFVC